MERSRITSGRDACADGGVIAPRRRRMPRIVFPAEHAAGKLQRPPGVVHGRANGRDECRGPYASESRLPDRRYALVATDRPRVATECSREPTPRACPRLPGVPQQSKDHESNSAAVPACRPTLASAYADNSSGAASNTACDCYDHLAVAGSHDWPSDMPLMAGSAKATTATTTSPNWLGRRSSRRCLRRHASQRCWPIAPYPSRALLSGASRVPRWRATSRIDVPSSVPSIAWCLASAYISAKSRHRVLAVPLATAVTIFSAWTIASG